tara:strand:- start:43 stop:885 length:843 start_codon:yes stop_codon:yes gene_type:complete
MKICKVIFSVNRLEYLIPTLESTELYIDWGDHEVDGIFIDDMPTGRNDEELTTLAAKYGYNKIILHSKNLGLSSTWKASYELLKNQGYDFIWHQEDDIIINQPIKINDMIKYLNQKESCYQVHLSRQTDWYDTDQKDLHKREGSILKEWNNFYTIPHIAQTFSASFSLTKANHYVDALVLWQNNKMPNVARGTKIFAEGFIWEVINSYSKSLGNSETWGITFYDDKKNQITEHIGEWTWGHRVPKEYLKNASGTEWYQEKLKGQINNPTIKINSRTWKTL